MPSEPAGFPKAASTADVGIIDKDGLSTLCCLPLASTVCRVALTVRSREKRRSEKV